MTQKWQQLHERLRNELTVGKRYDVINSFEQNGTVTDRLELSGVFLGYEKGRYLFEKEDGVYRVNLHKMKNPNVTEVI